MGAARVRAHYLPALDLLPNIGLILVLAYGGHQVLDGRSQLGHAGRAFNLYIGLLIWPLRSTGPDHRPRPAGRGLGPAGAGRAGHRPGHRGRRRPGRCCRRLARSRCASRTSRSPTRAAATCPCSTALDLTIAAGRVGGAGGCHRQRQVHRGPTAAPLLRRRRGPHPPRRRRRARPAAARPAPGHRHRVRGDVPVQRHHRQQHRLRRSRRRRRPDPAGRPPGRGRTSSSAPCPTATAPRSASGASRCRVASASALAIARAILADPRVLILDDATSSVDPTKEHEIRDALAEVMRRRTTIVIAHRPATIALADRVVLLDARADRGRGHPHRPAGHQRGLPPGAGRRRAHEAQDPTRRTTRWPPMWAEAGVDEEDALDREQARAVLAGTLDMLRPLPAPGGRRLGADGAVDRCRPSPARCWSATASTTASWPTTAAA